MKVHKNKKITATTLPFLTRPDLTVNVNRSPFGIKFQSTLQLNAMLAKICPTGCTSKNCQIPAWNLPSLACNSDVGQKLLQTL